MTQITYIDSKTHAFRTKEFDVEKPKTIEEAEAILKQNKIKFIKVTGVK